MFWAKPLGLATRPLGRGWGCSLHSSPSTWLPRRSVPAPAHSRVVAARVVSRLGVQYKHIHIRLKADSSGSGSHTWVPLEFPRRISPLRLGRGVGIEHRHQADKPALAPASAEQATTDGDFELNTVQRLWRGGPLFLFYDHHKDRTRPEGAKSSTLTSWTVLLALTTLNVTILLQWHSYEEASLPSIQAHFTSMYQNWTTSLRNVVQERFHTLLTPCVSHSDLAHLGGNLFALWLFGFKTCQAIGAFRFLALYATGGVVANVGHLLYTYIVKVPPGVKLVDFGDVPMTISIAPTEDAEEGDPKWEVNDPDLKDKHLFMLSKLDPPSLGASGSVMAISASAALLFPRDRISFVMRGLPLRLSLPFAVFLHVAGDFSGLTQPEKDDNIGHAAHLGGTLLGVVFTLVYWYSRRGLPGTLTHLPILNHLWKIWLGPRGHLAPWKNLKPTVQPLKSK